MPLECNRENMTRLVEALESGCYKQGRYVLRRPDDTYCCLGVACDLSFTGRWMRDADSYSWNYVTEEGYNDCVMPKPVIEWLGLPTTAVSDGDIDSSALYLPSTAHPHSADEPSYGTSLNDNGSTFEEIAAAIRKDYLTDPEPAAEPALD
jgi:hypothetical protein